METKTVIIHTPSFRGLTAGSNSMVNNKKTGFPAFAENDSEQLTKTAKLIGHVIALIDQHINSLVNNILHHPDLQNLEARWRGLFMLINEISDNQRIVIKVLNISYLELNKDVTNAIEFDQSQIFKKVYAEEYGQPGGLPYGLLIGDYYFSHKPISGVRDGMELLAGIAQIAAAAFVPFITSIMPSFFGLNECTEFQVPLQVDDILKLPEYHRWNRLRKEEDSRFLGITLPRILLRNPYNADGIKTTQRFFKEEIHRHNDYLWGNACYAFARVVIQCFKETGWFADIRGKGMIELIQNYFTTDKKGLVPKCPIEYQFTDSQEKLLSEAGFLVLRYNRMLEKGVFYSSQSLQKPANLTTQAGTTNIKLAAMLHYILCASRFAHYIKVITRDKLGKFLSAKDCEHYLAKWLQKYCSATQSESEITGARYPLNAAQVEVQEQQGSAGKYYCIIHLKPQYQLDAMEASLKLITDIKIS
jgi:type VI secretion system protein ImpD